MQSNQSQHASSDGNRQGPNGPSPNGHAPESLSTAPDTGWTATPNALLDIYGLLSSSERDALTYIVRRTLGFKDKHDGDAIPYNQFLHGTRSSVDGHMLDYGCGIKSSATLHKALARLEQRGLIAVVHPPRTAKKALIPTATYRVILPPPALEIEAAGGPAAGPATLEIEAAPLQLLKRSTLETEAAHFRNQSGATLEIEASIDRGKTGRKDREKESGKDSLSRAGARAREPQVASHPSAGDTSSSRVVEAPQETQLAFAENLVHGPRMAPRAPHHPDGETSPNGLAAGPPADKTADKNVRSLEVSDDEPDEEWAPKVFLREARGFNEADPANRQRFWWPKLQPLLDRIGNRSDFARWAHALRGDPWLEADRERWGTRTPTRWMEAVETWLALPPAEQDKTAAQRVAEREAREQDKRRDPRKVDNRTRDVEVLQRCVCCAADVGALHYDYCEVRFLGDRVTTENVNRPLMAEKILQRDGGQLQGSASKERD